LDWGVDVWGSEGVDVWGSEKKVMLFGLGYVRVDMWRKFMGVCDWWNGCEEILIFFKSVKCKFTNLSLFSKIFE